MEIPSRTVVREMHLYSVVDIKMHWHMNGTFLGVKLARQKTKKTIINNFEIFRIKVKNIPKEVLTMTDSVIAFAWEPQGHRFAVAHTANMDVPKANVSIYQLKSNKLKLLHTLEDRPANALFWSPNGQFLVIAGLGALNGALEFYDANAGDSLMRAEHFMCNGVEWCPSGRYVMTAVTQDLFGEGGFSRYTMDNGYKLWSSQGELLITVPLDQCYQVIWRPRPATLLTKDQIREIKEKLKEKYWNTYLKEDEAIKQSQLSGAAKEKQEAKDFWRTYRQEQEAEYALEAPFRRELRGGLASDDEDDYMLVEQLVTLLTSVFLVFSFRQYRFVPLSNLWFVFLVLPLLSTLFTLVSCAALLLLDLFFFTQVEEELSCETETL